MTSRAELITQASGQSDTYAALLQSVHDQQSRARGSVLPAVLPVRPVRAMAQRERTRLRFPVWLFALSPQRQVCVRHQPCCERSQGCLVARAVWVRRSGPRVHAIVQAVVQAVVTKYSQVTTSPACSPLRVRTADALLTHRTDRACGTSRLLGLAALFKKTQTTILPERQL